METYFRAKFLERYAVQAEPLSPQACRFRFRTEDGHGEFALAELYPGVQVYGADLCIDELETPPLEPCRSLTLRYGFSGCCELRLPQERYAYANEGWLCMETAAPDGALSLPTGRYIGLEIVIDLQTMLHEAPCAWTECGIDILSGAERLAQRQGRYSDEAAPEWDRLAHTLAGCVWSSACPIGDCRFFLLQLLWLLKSGGQSYEDAFLTRGQRTLAARAEALLTRDLHQRYTVAELAEKLGVSAASLKKYFVQAYGKPISSYMRGLRMKRAKELLMTSAMSIAAVANEVGYENQGKFGAVFRQETGLTPLEYRRLHQFPSE